MKSDFKTPEFLAKNPVGYLPFLEDGDFSLAESAAIAEYGESLFCSYWLSVSCSWLVGFEEEKVQERRRREREGKQSAPDPKSPK
jgi:glutathione S-transferase